MRGHGQNWGRFPDKISLHDNRRSVPHFLRTPSERSEWGTPMVTSRANELARKAAAALAVWLTLLLSANINFL